MTTPSLRTLWWLAALIVAMALLATLYAALLGDQTGPRSADTGKTIPSSLSELTSAVRPVIAAIERYRGEKGFYPVTATDMAGRLPDGVLADQAGDTLSLDLGHGILWVYLRHPDGQGYELTRHITDGGSVVAETEHGTITWLFAESDDEDLSPVSIPQS